MTTILRTLYRCLLWLHPMAFRTEFAGEMLWIFDETRATEGTPRLLWDATVSLFRQRLLRSTYWRIPVALGVAFLQVSFVMGWLSTSHPYIASRIAYDQFRGEWSGEARLEGRPVPLMIDFVPTGTAWNAQASLDGVPLRVNQIRVEPGVVRFQLDSGLAVVEFEGKRAPRGGRLNGVAKGALHGTFTLVRD